jgi:nitroreductase
MRSVLSGTVYFQRNAGLRGTTDYQLRRNIHRIEKGLVIQPRKDVFARDYILDTVMRYQEACRTLGNQESRGVSPETQWAHDVLEEYFRSSGQDPVVSAARAVFAAASGPLADKGMRPYARSLCPAVTVTYDAFNSLCLSRRSVRTYKPVAVPGDLLDKALSTAALSPSACNRQAFHFHIIDARQLIEEFSRLSFGMQGFASTIPMLVVVSGYLGAYFDERDRHVIYIDASLAAMSFMLSLETLGLSSCPINWPDNSTNESEARALLDLGEDERIVMLISVGYADPAGYIPYSCKKTVDEMRSYHR